MTTDITSPKIVLFMTRLGIAYLLFVWGMDKLINPDHAATIFDHFYNMGFLADYTNILGGLQVLLSAAILLGLWKNGTYGLAFILHTVSVFSTSEQILQPLTDGHQLFAAGLALWFPVVGWYLAREHDTLWTFGSK